MNWAIPKSIIRVLFVCAYEWVFCEREWHFEYRIRKEEEEGKITLPSFFVPNSVYKLHMDLISLTKLTTDLQMNFNKNATFIYSAWNDAKIHDERYKNTAANTIYRQKTHTHSFTHICTQSMALSNNNNNPNWTNTHTKHRTEWKQKVLRLT